MQLWILLKKDLKALFKQKAVIFTLLIPMIMIIGLGVLPSVIGVDEPLKVGLLNQDQGLQDLNLGNTVHDALRKLIDENKNIKLINLSDYSAFESQENAIWLPANFTKVANETASISYFMKYSDTDLRASSIMNGVLSGEIEKVVTEELLSVDLPAVAVHRIFTGDQVSSEGERQNRAQIAFPLAYMSFLILILSSSSMRVTGFSAEREAGMMELLLSSVIDRKELVMSKLLTGVTYGFASVMSYVVGLLITFLVQGNSTPSEEVSFLIFSPELITPKVFILLIFLFADLAFVSIQILLGAQLILGREAGDRLGSMVLMIMSFLFYFSSIGDPLAEGPLQFLNPFFWPFRITLNLIFETDWSRTILYLILNIGLSWYLLILKTRAIEKERVIFE